MGRLRALLVGVSKYNLPALTMNDLPFCKNDLLWMSYALQKGLRVHSTDIAIIGINSIVTQEEFFIGLKRFLSTIDKDDTLLFYFSGHGTINDHKHYFVLSDGCISTQAVVDLFDVLPTKNRIVILDSCMSGEYELSEPRELNASTWLDGFLEIGCSVLSSCNATEYSGFAPNMPISLFTAFLCEAIMSKFGIHEGKKSFDDIRDFVCLRAESWNAQAPVQKHQTPIYRSNVGGSIMFTVDDYHPYECKEYFSEHEDYIIHDVEPTHNGIAKRYSVKVILKKPVDGQTLAAINQAIIEELRNVEIFANPNSEKLWKGKAPNIIFSFFGYDDSDIVNGNYAYRTVWADQNQDRSWWYRETRDSMIIDDIHITTVPYYDYMHKFNDDHTSDKNTLVRETKDIIARMVALAESVIGDFREMQNHVISEEELIQRLQDPLFEIDKLYMRETQLDLPPVQLHAWSQLCSNIAATIHDFTIYYGKMYVQTRTQENRIQCMKMTIKRYQADLQKLQEEEKRMPPLDDDRRIPPTV